MERYNILVVEDDQDINRLLCKILEDGGYWVTAQTNRLLRSFVEHHPDRRMLELQSHPLLIPDKIDSWLVATVC